MSDNSENAAAANGFEDLELPSMTPGSLIRKFGPGMMLMMTGIGTSHLVTAPVAGGRFGYALLWCLPIAYIHRLPAAAGELGKKPAVPEEMKPYPLGD